MSFSSHISPHQYFLKSFSCITYPTFDSLSFYGTILTFTYFLNDRMKQGGSYVTMTERVRKIDAVNRKIVLYKTVGTSQRYMELDMDKIKDISGDLVSHIFESA
ncbi:hypothetical protein [Ruminococcus sp.]|uniref:hypothetical protein n=1 Tax=Ruminococcus sp. TaxID=41978 RepID=UPI0025EB97F9|nr:hypothetical protein [Ruminococcus sp.]